ncbi:putative Undecaprenyl-phosphate alpha-N-acetylglucosaminyl 1-phosphate transferase (Modular protein) [Nitrospira sp. ND1]|jgi:UDP-GlcNAc:undecaprenyl-phosphate GlcNAc-1-phosphate transferase|uniref:glycosyltransferase family 4 protein n=1 Tax=Nitrospira sp. ND1 TaxID=1658518 RepID=UPI0009BA6750|nr:MraY family glycosyltransferase [Nitrospira sp. ND1]SLM42029.1 putative Undecaprenyl-phosphate alpha-N-acetylglucosaminyl 1-phosphate transferase (Modular protein) [Nitrospira sp. ND1]
MTSAIFFSFITSLFICMALIPPLQLNAGRWSFMDLPGERKVHANPIPRIGGIAFGFAALLSVFFWAPQDPIITPVLVSATIILGFGIWDDRANLNYRTKLVGQLLAIFVVVIFGHIHFEQIPFLHDEEAPLWLTMPLTVVFLVGASNAVNLSDGLDGLAGGLAFLSFAGIAYLAYLSHETTVLVLAAGFLGGLLGFLRYNTYPARIFMGDAGSQLLGFSMGVLVLLMSDPARAPFPVTVGLLVLGLPFLDTLAVMGQRLAKGRSPFIGDRNHVHHKLLALGLSHHEAVIVIYGIQAVMVGLAYLLRWQSDALIFTMYGAFALAMFALFVAAERGGLLLSETSKGRVLSDTKLARAGIWLSDMAPRFLAVVVPLFLIASVFLPGHVPMDVGYAAFSLFAVVLGGLWFMPEYRSHFVRGGLYVGSAFLMYMGEQSGIPEIWPIYVTQNTLLALIALLVLLSMRFSRGNRFQTTPLDYLMVFFALIVPLLPEMRADMPTLSILAAKLIVLYFSFELLLHSFVDRVKHLGFLSLWVLFGLGVRAWL